MGLRAERDNERCLLPGRSSGLALRAPSRGWTGLPALLMAAVLAPAWAATPCTAQRTAQSAAFVQVPSVSQLDVVSHESLAREGGTEAGVFRIRVRANHPWKVVLSAASGADGEVWVRSSTDGAGSFNRLDAGAEAVVATGGRGLTVVEIEYRREVVEGSVAALPLIYTLASL